MSLVPHQQLSGVVLVICLEVRGDVFDYVFNSSHSGKYDLESIFLDRQLLLPLLLHSVECLFRMLSEGHISEIEETQGLASDVQDPDLSDYFAWSSATCAYHGYFVIS